MSLHSPRRSDPVRRGRRGRRERSAQLRRVPVRRPQSTRLDPLWSDRRPDAEHAGAGRGRVPVQRRLRGHPQLCAEPRGLADRADAGAQRGRIQPQVQEGGHPLAPRGAPRARVRDGRLRESRPRAERRRPARVRSHRPAPDVPVVAEFLATRDKAKPLCLFVGTHEPHVPWPDNDGYRPDEPRCRQPMWTLPKRATSARRYYTDVTKADTLLGEVRQSTRETFGENSLFLYTSDHGAEWPFAKWNLYDVGIRVPLLVEWPGVIKPGSTSDAMVQLDRSDPHPDRHRRRSGSRRHRRPVVRGRPSRQKRRTPRPDLHHARERRRHECLSDSFRPNPATSSTSATCTRSSNTRPTSTAPWPGTVVTTGSPGRRPRRPTRPPRPW